MCLNTKVVILEGKKVEYRLAFQIGRFEQNETRRSSDLRLSRHIRPSANNRLIYCTVPYRRAYIFWDD